MKRLLKKLGNTLIKNHGQAPASREAFSVDDNQILKRTYSDYKEYLAHQSEKLGRKFSEIQDYDRNYEKIIIQRYSGKFDFSGRSVLCLAARLGGEVRGFKALGALAIGIDIEPGPGNEHVLFGDFHNLAFPDASFDFVFTNAIDHAFDLGKLLEEAGRVLKPNGVFIAELAQVKAGEYEVLDTEDLKPVLRAIERYFNIEETMPLQNDAGFVNWDGILLSMRKK